MSDNIPIRKSDSNQVNKNIDVSPEVLSQLENDVAQQSSRGNNQTTFTYPTETIDLPSEGYFYPEDSILSKGRLELKYMTAKEEDILTSQNLIKKGVVLDRLLDELIVTNGVSSGDLIVGDRNAVFVAARILAYGPKYEVKVSCPKCGEENQVTIDLAAMANKDFDFSGFTKGVNEFTYQLPISKRNITYKFLTGNDEKSISQELESLSKVNKNATSPEVTTRLKYMIVAVDGKTDRQLVKNFVDKELTARDAREFRKHIKESSPDFDMTFDFVCEHCDHEGRIPMPMGISFFWPDAEL